MNRRRKNDLFGYYTVKMVYAVAAPGRVVDRRCRLLNRGLYVRVVVVALAISASCGALKTD